MPATSSLFGAILTASKVNAAAGRPAKCAALAVSAPSAGGVPQALFYCQKFCFSFKTYFSSKKKTLLFLLKKRLYTKKTND